MIQLFDYIGTVVFAITGALVARGKRIDLFGVIVFGIVTAVGGGTLRDLLLGRTPVFWIRDPLYVWLAAGAAVFTFMVVHWRNLPRRVLLVADALGLALFTVIGAQVALDSGASPLIAVIMAVMTGTGGGITRDLLAREIPLVLRREIYATASMIGAIIYVVWAQITTAGDVALIVSIAVTTALRLLSIKLGGQLPLFLDDPSR